MRIEFINDDNFVVYYISENDVSNEDGMKVFFKSLSNRLKKQYRYHLKGYYNVNAYQNHEVIIFEFENVDDYGQADFNITLLVNSVILYEFEDYELIDGDKILYNNHCYVEVETVINKFNLFEHGNFIYGKKVEEVLDKGILINT